jgi:hypothetical protein
METQAAELSPALHASALNLDYLIGGVFVIVYAASRFNTPATNRSTTTWMRYHCAATMYLGVGLLLFGLLAAYQPLQAALRHALPILGLDHDASDVAARLSPPLLAALFLTVLLPKIPYLSDLDGWIRQRLQHMAAIPFEARRVSAELRRARFNVPDTTRARLSEELLADDFRQEDLLFEESAAVQHLWTKIAVLMRHLESLEADHRFAAFMAGYTAELASIRDTYTMLVPKARKCFRLTRELPPDQDTERSRVPDAVREYRDEFAEQARDLLGTIYDFLGRGVLQSRHSYYARCELLQSLGFDVHITKPPLTLNQHVILFVLLHAVLILGFAVAELVAYENRGGFTDVFMRALRIAVLYNVAIVCAVYRPQHLALARRDDRGFRPVAWYALIGALAVAVVLPVNVMIKVLWNPAVWNSDLIKALVGFDGMASGTPVTQVLQDVVADVAHKFPWLFMTFLTAAGTAYLADDRPGPRLTPTRLRWVEGGMLATVAALGAVVVWYWLAQTGGLPPHMHFAWHVIRAWLLGFAIGFLIPTWFRESRQPRARFTTTDVRLVLEPQRS